MPISSNSLSFILTVLSGLFWTITYILIINRSFHDKSYGMPYWALAFNISWEFIFSFLFVPQNLTAQLVVNRIWFCFDIVIVISYFLYGRKDWIHSVKEIWFLPYSLLVIAISFVFIYTLSLSLRDFDGSYAAFTQNLMMSWLFIAMLNRRPNLEGQSFGIALFKLLGTLAPTLLFGIKHRFILITGLCCFVTDTIYLVMIISHYRSLGINLITRQKKIVPADSH